MQFWIKKRIQLGNAKKHIERFCKMAKVEGEWRGCLD